MAFGYVIQLHNYSLTGPLSKGAGTFLGFKMKKFILLVAVLGLLLLPQLAQAQSQRNPCFYTTENAAQGNGCIPVSAATPFPVTLGAPVTQTPLSVSATGTTNATVAALPNAAGKTTFICGFSISSSATTGLTSVATVSGPASSLTFVQSVGTSPAIGGAQQTFTPCIPASAANTPILVTSAAAGTGGITTVSAWGYQQ
jgi:hypothetical protein